MPYPNEHSARLRDPSDFKEKPDWSDGGKFRRTSGGTIYGRIKVPESVGVIWGQLKSQTGKAAAPQALRFPTASWTAARAKAWLKQNNVKYLRFESAKGEAGSSPTRACYSKIHVVADCPIDFQAGNPADGRLPRFEGVAYSGGPFLGAGPSGPLVIDLAGLEILPGPRPILREHDSNRPLGHTEKIEKAEQKLHVSGVFSSTGPHVDEVLTAAGRGFPWRLSLGFMLGKVISIDESDEADVNGRKIKGPALIGRKTTLVEVSFVAVPADPHTSARIAATANGFPLIGAIAMSFDSWLTERGFDAAALSEEQRASLQTLFEAEMKAAEKAEERTDLVAGFRELKVADPGPATFEELVAGLPDADEKFLFGQLKAKATFEAARQAWVKGMQDRIKSQDQEIAQLKARLKQPGVEPLGQLGPDGQPPLTATARWNEAVEAKIKQRAGRTKYEAAKLLAIEQPELREAYVQEVNAAAKQ